MDTTPGTVKWICGVLALMGSVMLATPAAKSPDAGRSSTPAHMLTMPAHGESRDAHDAGSSLSAKVVDEAERDLYLMPGGLYTEADIRANGNQTASEKFAGFRAKHDMNPKSGEKVCPITATKANGACTWIVNGKEYAFCCPPCVDEFVRLAKEDPAKVLAPGAYVK